MFNKILEVSKSSGVPVKKIVDLFFLLKDGPIENNTLLRSIGIAKSSLNFIKQSFAYFLDSKGIKTGLKQEYISQVKQLFSDEYKLEEDMFALPNKELLEYMSKHRQVPAPKREFDQFSATIETVVRRAALLSHFEDIKGKRILLLGDDDLTSCALSHLGGALQIVVADIDQRILNAVEKVDPKIKTVLYDARRSLPGELFNSFDIVVTDPPYTPQGFELFTSRAVEALNKKNAAARIYVCYGSSDRAKERFLPIYLTLSKSGLMIRWVLDKFNRYIGAESIGSASSLIVADITPKTVNLVKGKYNEPIYTND